MVDLVRLCLVSEKFLSMIRKRIEFLIDSYGLEVTMFQQPASQRGSRQPQLAVRFGILVNENKGIRQSPVVNDLARFVNCIRQRFVKKSWRTNMGKTLHWEKVCARIGVYWNKLFILPQNF